MITVTRFAAVGIMLCLVLMAGMVVAQDAPAAGCSAEDLTALVSEIQTANGAALTAIEAGDLTTAVDALAASDEQVGIMKATCAGLAFEGASDDVIGPVDIPEGVYRVTVTTAGFIGVTVTPLDGECGEVIGTTVVPIMSFFQDQATDGAEAVMPSEGCTALIEVTNVTAPYTLTFENLG